MKALELLLLAVLVGHVVVCPFTKVEESFNLHATHDILTYGIYAGRSQYDHHTFPGVVPRSFIGSLALAFITSPLILVAKLNRVLESHFELQILVRSVLAVANGLSTIFLYRSARRIFGRSASSMALGLTIVQFHLPFYAGRTLPNMLAFAPVQIALALPLRSNPTTKKGKAKIEAALMILAFIAAVLRLELVTLIAPLCLYFLAYEHLNLLEVLAAVVPAGIAGAGIVLSFFADSYFWNTPVWPEFQAAYFNIVEGKSIAWGVSPWHYYFTNSLPKLLTTSYPFLILSTIYSRSKKLVFPLFASIALLSWLQHKEWRFIIYCIPTFNLCSSYALSKLSPTLRRTIYPLLLLSTLAATTLSLSSSLSNYPGGVAVQLLHTLPSPPATLTSKPKSVHLDSYATQTGASLFVLSEPVRWIYMPTSSPLDLPLSIPSYQRFNSSQGSQGWEFDRSEDLSDAMEFEKFDYLITSTPAFHKASFDIVERVDCFDGLQFGSSEENPWPVRIGKRDCLWVMRNRRVSS
ncbi:glycosyltransferase family 22 protein [Atractiella rhizophila]|nr:glycosyltransferase family 22 protein [Atractiella rhizophila]